MPEAIRTHQIPITRYPPATAHEVQRRYRCIEARHEGRTYNPIAEATWCLCGRVIRPGNTATTASDYETAETSVSRPDRVGRRARAYLDEVHSRGRATTALTFTREDTGRPFRR